MKNIWVPLSGQIAQQRKVEIIANNIANANTAGFKKDRLVFKEHLTALTKGSDNIDLPNKEWSPDDFYRTQGAENAYVKVDGSYTDFEQGDLKPTNNPLDMALFGKGFFEVLTPNGVRFTRKGNFAVSKDGELVTDRGFKLLSPPKAEGSQGGDQAAQIADSSDIEKRIIKIPAGTRISVSKEGEIFSSQGSLGKISVVEFNDIHALKKQGNALFINNHPKNVKRENVATTVNQGFMEGSNVNAIQEMSELIKAHRHFENIQKAINTYDSISGKAANDIARF
ncbi:MAG: flagellar basal-body rod protein FlgF [Halobacteriovoraceae bacterium]|nr:flagellar basal-body rod protein FlgF [Halobacteriovoraceae bacterium]